MHGEYAALLASPLAELCPRQQWQKKPKEGEVLALGDGPVLKGGERGDFQVRVGDRIIFTSYAGTEVKIDGDEYLIMSEDDVLAVVD